MKKQLRCIVLGVGFCSAIVFAGGREKHEFCAFGGTEGMVKEGVRREPLQDMPYFQPHFAPKDHSWTGQFESLPTANTAWQQMFAVLEGNPACDGAATVAGGGLEYLKANQPVTVVLHRLKMLGFRAVGSPDGTYSGMVNGVEVIPIWHAPRTMNARPSSFDEKRLLWSFIGYNQPRPVDVDPATGERMSLAQRIMRAAQNNSDAFVKLRKKYHGCYGNQPERKERHEQEYLQTMAESWFVICPRANTPWTFRPTEALGDAIPVIISDGAQRPDMPIGLTFDDGDCRQQVMWDDVAVTVNEKHVDCLRDYLNDISENERRRMLLAGLTVRRQLERDPAMSLRWAVDHRLLGADES